jgi:hypothetical protein
MKRRLAHLFLIACLGAALVPAAQAQPAEADLLQAIPSDAAAALAIRSAANLDEKVISISQQLNLPPNSLLTMAKSAMNLGPGINDKGGVAVVLLGLNNPGNPMEGLVVLVPVSDYAGFTANMNTAPVGEGYEGISSATISGEASYVTQYGAFAGVAPLAEPLRQLLAGAGKTTIGKTWTPYELERFAADDVTLWINMEAVLASPMVQGALQMVAGMGGGMFNPEELKETRSFVVSLRLENQGLRLGFYNSFQEGSPSAQLAHSVQPTADSLLTGLPDDDYLGAFGMRASKEGMAKYARIVSAMLANPLLAQQAQMDPAKLQRISELLTQMVSGVRGVTIGVSSLPGGPHGQYGFAKVLTFESNAAGATANIKELIETLLSGVPAAEGQLNPRELVEYKQAAETLDGITVDHLVVHLHKAPDIDPVDLTNVRTVLGEEGVLFRFGAIDDTRLVATFGGGAARFQQVAALAKAGEAPLANNEGLKSSAALLPNERILEGYFAVDQFTAAVNATRESLGVGARMPYLGELNAPVAVAAWPVPPAGMQADCVLPMPLVSAIKDQIMAAAAGGPADFDTSGEADTDGGDE